MNYKNKGNLVEKNYYDAVSVILKTIVGQKICKDTEGYKNDPLIRIKKCSELMLINYKKSTIKIIDDQQEVKKRHDKLNLQLLRLESLSIILKKCI